MVDETVQPIDLTKHRAQKSIGEEKPAQSRQWSPGYKGKTEKGEFVVLRGTSTGYLVEYTSGPWEGKFIDMPKEIGGATKTVEGLRLSKEEKENFLDMFYNEFPSKYKFIYDRLYYIRNIEPTTSSVLQLIRDEFPVETQMTLNIYLQSK